ncbi:uncharacterized protein LOC129744846 isoform X1 [Uranotaenia lowii]|uniref:uncharacterized protein LOC129744846 isoform X1 n=1 Tax=Uranotaenia lowii TaxID=190385 RepID=UPI002479DC62|nr:uncharacterized protein LOC129744846 isoform X1 [Uranotaenia lowii]XP_055593551.1 uncharacterized protein LOC129744846 isoform X1 [Uranotaenia lowii]XP_055593552.1 uncharacterized protein LOC129744846 isoform X1 [Uranotaenia lowii]XP_055593553.1 uncharacterized protein LOC129744846 isoform X1 [Uranotaenia lowii]XP_055593554.1 uncharacterized protein LOC129744846 isoform X1 [Uranotaenia lowii]XP_055593555.1 uncharacterized protein LOC129744846 isoform X1 [Uranotaenia lowii]
MTNAIRVAVSKNRHRYKKDGFDLDLSYINERIIAMGYPAEKVESFYRNKIDDVHKMLEMKHHGCYKVYNLCSERSYDAKRFPSYSVYPFKDHNPPDIELITAFCRDVDEYLRADPKNVVAVHCKAGKGRTGTMISCYLMYSRQFNTAGEALDYYAQQRTNDAKGVTIPSQRRYVEYYASLLQSNELYRSVTLYLCEIRVTPGVNIREGSIHVNGSDLVSLVDIKRTDDATVAKLYCCMPLNGDVKIEFLKSTVLRKEKGFHFWFNTFFVAKMAKRDGDGNLLLTLSKTEIDDAHKDKQHKVYPKNFTVQMVLQTVPAGKYSESVSLQKCHPSSPPPGSIQMQMTNTTSPTDGGGLLVIHSPSSPLINCNLPPQTVLHPQVPSQFHPPHRQQLNNSTSDPYRQPGLARAPLGNNHQNNHNNHNQLDENNHSCVEYSETSSSESSTEEEGWDSGECPTLLLAPPQDDEDDSSANKLLYYRNDNYYYGSCAGLGSEFHRLPPPRSPKTDFPSVFSSSSSGSSFVERKASESNSRPTSSPNVVANLPIVAASSSRNSSSSSSKLPASVAVESTNSVQNFALLSPVPSSVTDHKSQNGKIFSGVKPLTTSTTNNISWPLSIGMRKKTQKKKSFKSNNFTSFSGTREYGSNVSNGSIGSTTSQGKVTSGKNRFYKLRWLKSMRSDPNMKEVLLTSFPGRVSVSKVGHRAVVEEEAHVLPKVSVQPSESSEEIFPSSLDYYSSICDKQLSYESPSKSPGHLMKQNLNRKPFPTLEEVECPVVIAKPNEKGKPKIGFEVSPVQSPTAKVFPEMSLPSVSQPSIEEESVEKSACDSKTPIESPPSPRSYSLLPKSENTSFCDRILQSIVGSRKSSSDNELQVPSASNSTKSSPLALRSNRCSPFSLRELGQELKSVMRTANPASQSPTSTPTKTSKEQDPPQAPAGGKPE